jgi:tripartite-type tricarboxylate transporter receptor subunit TctC
MKANRAGYASSGVGSSDHLTMELFRLLTGTEAVHVPYSGSAPALVDLVAGNVHISFQNLGSASPHISSGRLRAIMITSARRHPLFPNVPTTAEAGLRDFVVTSWQAVMAPAGLPPAIQARLHDSAAAALKHPETIARMAQIGFDVVAGTPAECSAFQQAELARWRHVVETAGIKPE